MWSLTNPEFTKFRGTLDAHMTELKSTGKYQPKKAETISEIYGNLLWEKHLLGDSNPQQLINTVVHVLHWAAIFIEKWS